MDKKSLYPSVVDPEVDLAPDEDSMQFKLLRTLMATRSERPGST